MSEKTPGNRDCPKDDSADTSRAEARRDVLREALGAGYGTSWPALVRQVKELRARGEDTSGPHDGEQASPDSEVRDLRATLAQRERELKRAGEARHQAERDRDRLRTAWRSACRRAVDERGTSDMHRFFASAFERDLVKLRRQVKEDRDWREAYNQLCSDLAYALGMSGASIISDHQVKAGVKALAAEVVRLREESARSYSQGVEDMRKAAVDEIARAWPITYPRTPAEQCMQVTLAVRNVTLTKTAPDPHGGEEVFPGSIRAAEDALEASLEDQPDDLASRVAELEELTASLSDLAEKHSRDMAQAQAALRGLGATSPPVEACDTTGVHGPHQWDHTAGPRRCMGAY